MRKGLLTVAVIMLCLLSVFAGGSKEEAASSDTVIRIAVPGLGERQTIDPISGIVTPSVADAQKQYQAFIEKHIPGVRIELVPFSWDGWIQKMEVLVTSGDVDIGLFTNQIASAEWFMDLKPFMENDEDLNLDNFSDVFIDSAVYNSYYKSFEYPEYTHDIYGLPVGIANMVILYDKEIFDHYGVEYPKEGDTFVDLAEKAEQMTGIDPVTGNRTYGAFVSDHWMEWFSLSFDAIKPLYSDDMDIFKVNEDEYVEYMKDSQALLDFFNTMLRLVDCSPAGIATGSGAERFFTEDNNIAINFAVNEYSGTWLKYLAGNVTSVTDRFRPFCVPKGQSGYQGFPEYTNFGIAKNTRNPELAWEVLKILATDKELVDYYLVNLQPDKLPVIRDYDGMEILSNDVNRYRYDYQSDSTFVTDDYWSWRGVMRSSVCNNLLTKTYDAEQAREALYEGVKKWFADTKMKLGG